MNFIKAKPIWLKGLSKEPNIQAGFTAEFEADSKAVLFITGAYYYKVFLNGVFVHYGPARTAHGYARIDEIDLSKKVIKGKNIIAVEVAGYNCPCYDFAMQESYIQAEIRVYDSVICATNYNFAGTRIFQREQKCLRYSYQRTFTEVWTINEYYDKYLLNKGTDEIEEININKKYLQRNSKIPKFDVSNSHKVLHKGILEYHVQNNFIIHRFIETDNIEYTHFKLKDLTRNPLFEFKSMVQLKTQDINAPLDKQVLKKNEYILLDMGRNYTGFIKNILKVNKDARVLIIFDERLKDGVITDPESMVNIIDYKIDQSHKTYNLESFECYGFRYAAVLVLEGEVEILDFGIREYVYPINNVNFDANDVTLNNIFCAAVETFRQNTVDIFMDCPTRERAGWLCDSYYTAQTEYELTGSTDVEDDFMENYVYASEKHMPFGMLPMCYPADFSDGNYIPQWAMWYVLELSQYIKRNPNANKMFYKQTVYNLLDFFKHYVNNDGLLERLPKWNFVEWSKANKWVMDVNYPTNMLYYKVLSIVAELYNDKETAVLAENVKKVIIEQSYNGDFFTDNAVRNQNGTLENTGNISEVCQYYAVRMGIIDINDSQYAKLKETILHIFGYDRINRGILTNIEPANALMGVYLRMEILLYLKEYKKLLEEVKEYFGHMVESAGTLWEHNSGAGSLNHGFASFVAVAIKKCCAGMNKNI